MRGLAVLVVVAFHAEVGGLQGGFVGVDVFYVISGFLITGLLVDEVRRTGSVSLTAFYARRMRRLLPLSSLVLLTVALAFRSLLAPLDWPGLGRELLACAVWSANWQFAASSTDYLGDVGTSPVLHYWSLSVEEQFYLVWPLLIVALTAGRRRQGAAVLVRRLVVVLALVAGLSFAASVLTTGTSGPWAYFGLHTRAWELAAGALLVPARTAAADLPRVLLGSVGWVGLGLIGWAVLAFDRTTAFPAAGAAVPVAGAVLVLLAGMRGSGAGVSRLLCLRPLTYAGRISYAWYLWHWPCLVAVRLWNAPVVTGEDGDLTVTAPDGVRVAVAVAASFLLAAVSHRLVEQPVRRAAPLARSHALSLATGAALLVVATVGTTVLLRPPTGDAAAAGGGSGAGLAAGAAFGTGPTANPAQDPAVDPPAGPPAGSDPGDAGGTQATAPVFPPPGRELTRTTPAQARADQVRLPGCLLGFAGTQVSPSCVFGDPRGSTVVVAIGDSHLAHWFPALERTARQRHWRLYLWAKSGCGYAAVRQWLESYRRSYTECGTWRDAVLARVAALPRVDAVIVGRSGRQLGKLTDPDGHPLGGPAAVRQWGHGSAEVLARLADHGRRVVLLRDVPRPDGDVPACLSANPGDPRRCDYPREAHVDPDGAIFAAESPAVAASGVRVVEVGDLVCATQPCPVIAPSGSVIFRDGHHLTASFARDVADALGARLAAAIAR